MSAPPDGQVATASRQAGHVGGERFRWRGTIETLTPGHLATTISAQRRSLRSFSLTGSWETVEVQPLVPVRLSDTDEGGHGGQSTTRRESTTLLVQIVAIGAGSPATGARVRKIEPLLSGSSGSPAVTT